MRISEADGCLERRSAARSTAGRALSLSNWFCAHRLTGKALDNHFGYWGIGVINRFSRNGVCGDAAAATPEFGRRMFEVTVQRFVELVQEFQTIAVNPRVDHH